MIVRLRPRTKIALSRPRSPRLVVRAPSVTIRGFATPGSRVKVGATVVDQNGGRFTQTVPLRHGRNVIWISAEKRGLRRSGARVVVTRRLSPAERAARRAQRRAEIAARRAQQRAAFMSAATTISYNQLIKNPDAYVGTRVKYYGEILQIQEGAGGGIMLLYVTNLGYDVWTDQIWVNGACQAE